MKTVAFITCTWQRPHISKIYRDELLKLQSKYDYKFINIVVDSDNSNSGVFGSEFSYSNTANNPISNKWNHALMQLKGLDFDYAVMMGSDDTMCDKVFAKLDSLMDDYSWTGVLDIYFQEYGETDLHYWSGYENRRRGEPVGVGRAISKQLIEKLDYRLWDNGLNKGLDGSMYRKIGRVSHATFRCKDVGGFLIDIKSENNLSKI